MTTAEMLDQLAELMSQRDMLMLDRQSAEKAAIPAEVAAVLQDIQDEFDPKVRAIDEKIASLDDAAKKAIAESGQTISGNILQGVYMPGRVTWDTKGLDEIVALLPEVGKFRKVGNPYAVIKRRS